MATSSARQRTGAPLVAQKGSNSSSPVPLRGCGWPCVALCSGFLCGDVPMLQKRPLYLLRLGCQWHMVVAMACHLPAVAALCRGRALSVDYLIHTLPLESCC